MLLKRIVLLLFMQIIVFSAYAQIKTEGRDYAFLFTEHLNDRVVICNENGDIVWEFACEHPQAAWMLPGGKRVLTSSKNRAMLIRIKDKKVIWNYEVDASYEIPYVQFLKNRHLIVGVEGKNTFYEFNRRGRCVQESKVDIKSQQVHGSFRFVQRTHENTYLIPVTAENQFREVDLDGNVLWCSDYDELNSVPPENVLTEFPTFREVKDLVRYAWTGRTVYDVWNSKGVVRTGAWSAVQVYDQVYRVFVAG